MGSIVRPILSKQSVESAILELQAAHDFLAVNGGKAIQRVVDLSDVGKWGQSVKRVTVHLPEEGRPKLCDGAPSEHSLTEVYNQCATIERLLDALRWQNSPASGWAGSSVLVCHPTNTSGRSENTDLDFDLAIQSPGGEVGCFEISDVASTKDGNFKEGTDLVKFGVLTLIRRGRFKVTGISRNELPGRCFLVVSGEFSHRMHRPRHPWLTGLNPRFHYDEVKNDGATRIFEIVVHEP